MWIRDSVIDIVTALRVRQVSSWGFIPSRSKGLVSTPKRQHWLWDPCSYLMGSGDDFPKNKTAGMSI